MSETIAIILGIFLAYIGIILFICLLAYVIQVVAYWSIFTKAGVPGWKALIPFYNVYVQYRISWTNPYMYWIYLVGFNLSNVLITQSGFLYSVGSILGAIAFLVNLMAALKLSRAFGHGVGYAIGLFFLGPIFMLIIGFGSSQYLGPQD